MLQFFISKAKFPKILSSGYIVKRDNSSLTSFLSSLLILGEFINDYGGKISISF
jgi:hypothetical protein